MRAILLLLAVGAASAATAIDCRAMDVAGPARVVDGDTLEIGTQAIRIHGIDAPEASQVCQLPKGTWDCSGAAVNVLRAIVEGKEVRCAGHEMDQYGRLIARCGHRRRAGHRRSARCLAWPGPSSSIRPTMSRSREPRAPRGSAFGNPRHKPPGSIEPGAGIQPQSSPPLLRAARLRAT
jgi:endonuclease YncB( thermonuclease family)